VVVLLYIAVHVVAQGVLGTDLAQGGTAPLAGVAGRVMGAAGVALIVAATAVSVFGNLAVDMICTPRAFFAVAESGVMPRAMARVHPTYRTP
jgi:amino acid transporter